MAAAAEVDYGKVMGAWFEGFNAATNADEVTAAFDKCYAADYVFCHKHRQKDRKTFLDECIKLNAAGTKSADYKALSVDRTVLKYDISLVDADGNKDSSVCSAIFNSEGLVSKVYDPYMGEVLATWFDDFNAASGNMEDKAKKEAMEASFEKVHGADFVFAGDSGDTDRTSWKTAVGGIATAGKKIVNYTIVEVSADKVKYQAAWDSEPDKPSTYQATFKDGAVCRVDEIKEEAATAAE